VTVPRGPNLTECSDAIVAAIEAEAHAKQERNAAAQRRQDEVFRAVLRRPDRIALRTLPR